MKKTKRIRHHSKKNRKITKKTNLKKHKYLIRQTGGNYIENIRGNILDLFSKWYTIYTGIIEKSRIKFDYNSNSGSSHVELEKASGSKKFYEYINNDLGLFSLRRAFDAIKKESISTYTKFFKSQLGGAVTYKLRAGNTLETKEFTGNDYPEGGIPLTENVLILGAGPNGVYMASILKAAMPDLNVNIVETRVSESKLRKLTRGGKLTIDKVGSFLNLPLIGESYNSPEFIGDVNELKSIIENFSSSLYYLFNTFRDDGKVDYLKLINFNEVNINYMEYYFARLGQYMGVNIFHENDIKDESYIRKFVNDKTLCIFDSTGGRFRRQDEFWNQWLLNNEHVIKRMENNAKTKDNSRLLLLSILYDRIERGETINLYEGYLPVELSINKEMDIPYISIGDTTIRTNYMNASGLNFNCLLSVMYTLLLVKIRSTFSKEYNDSKDTHLQKVTETINLFKEEQKYFEDNLPRLLEERRLEDEEAERRRAQERQMAARLGKEEAKKIRERGMPQEILSLEIEEKDKRIEEMIKSYLFEAYIYYIENPPSVHQPPLTFYKWSLAFEKNSNMKIYEAKYEVNDYEDYEILEKYLRKFVKENNDTFILTFKY